MSRLWLPRASKPANFAPRLDYTNDLTRDIEVACLLNEAGGQPIEMVNNRCTGFGSGAVWEAGDYGWQIYGTGNVSHVDLQDVTQAVNRLTCYLVFQYVSAGGAEAGMWSQYYSGATTYTRHAFFNVIFNTASKVRFEMNNGSYSSIAGATTPTVGRHYGVAVVLTGAARQIWLGELGQPLVLDGSGAYSSTLVANADKRACLNHHLINFSTAYNRSKLITAYYWPNRGMSEVELQALHADPWQLVDDYTARSWALKAPAAAGGGSTLKTGTLMMMGLGV